MNKILKLTLLFWITVSLSSVQAQITDAGSPSTSGMNDFGLVCGNKTDSKSVEFPAISVCGKNADEARANYKELVKASLSQSVACLYEKNCEGSDCELFVWDFTPPTISGFTEFPDGSYKYTFKKLSKKIDMECGCTEGDSEKDEYEPLDTLMCKAPAVEDEFHIVRHVICAASISDAAKKCKEIIKKQFGRRHGCDDSPCGGSPCSLEFEGTPVLNCKCRLKQGDKYICTPKSRMSSGDIKCDCECPESGQSDHVHPPLANYNRINLSSVYPNPTKAQLFIPIELMVDQLSLQIIVYNLKGQAVWYEDLESLNAGKHTLRIDMEELPTGQYFFKIANDQQVIGTDRFMIYR